MIRDGPSITSSSKNQEENKTPGSLESVFHCGEVGSQEMLDLNLAGMVPQGKVAGSRQRLGASSQLSIMSGKVGVAEANSWPNCARNGLVVG